MLFITANLILQISDKQIQATEAFLAESTKTLKAWSSAFNLLDESGTQLETIASHNMPDDWVAVKNPLDGNNFNARAISKDSVLRLNNMYLDTVAGTSTKHAITAVMIIPVMADGKLLGNLEFMHDQRFNSFSKEDEAFMLKEIDKLISILTNNNDD